MCIQLLGSGEGRQGSQWRVWQRDQGGQEERTAWVSVCVCVPRRGLVCVCVCVPRRGLVCVCVCVFPGVG